MLSQNTAAEPLITGLICTYNRCDLVRLVLDSLCEQTLAKRQFEVVVIDDGSTDGTKEVARSFIGRLPLRYTYQDNSGLAAAKNHGLQVAKAPLVVFMDDDDLATPNLLEEHLKTHRGYPEDNYAVLGHTRLDESIATKPLMHFVTEVGCHLFAYPRIKDEVLDYTYFWGGRSSCKRGFLRKYGLFNPVFRFGCEDIELGYRLSKHGLKVIYNAKALSTMFRELSIDDFIRRLIKQGESQYVFSRLHESPEVQQWTEVDGVEEAWRDIALNYDRITQSARALDRIANLKLEIGLPLDKMTEKLLHRAYWHAFRVEKIKGIVARRDNSVGSHDNSSDQSGRSTAVNMTAVASASCLMEKDPKLHAEGTKLWAIGPEVLDFIAEKIQEGAQTLETGAGLSTVLFASKGCNHTCISPVQDEHDRIKKYCSELGIDTSKVSFVLGYSHEILPRLECPSLDLVLIDGGHGFPVPFVDWLYTAEFLKEGGYVVVDDTQIWTPRVLVEFLAAEDGWGLVRRFREAVVFEKTSKKMLKDWGGQPFVAAQSETSEDWLWLRNVATGHMTALEDTVRRAAKIPNADLKEVGELERLALRSAECALVLEDHTRMRKAGQECVPDISSWDGTEKLTSSVMTDAAPWLKEMTQPCGTPAMISDEEKRYYHYIGQFFRGRGKVVELGPWLGGSTHYIIKGLLNNSNFEGEKLYVFDDFVWRPSWMNQYVRSAERLPRHGDFRPLFEKYSRDILKYLNVERKRISPYDGNEALPSMKWRGGAIEMLFVDCGRTYEVNEAWYRALRHAFLPRATIIVMQDWRLHRERPMRWYNQTKQFTDSKGNGLQLVHEVTDGGIATFLYTGAA